MGASDPIFETARLYARPWQIDDAEDAFAMYRDPEMVQYIGGNVVADVAAQREQIAAILERNRRLWDGRYGSWPLIEKTSGGFVGVAILKPPPASGRGGEPSEDIEIGWHVVRPRWGRGIASEAGRALLEHGFGALGLEMLHAVVDSPNVRSMAVARRIGMRHTGKTARYYDLELEHFELARSEWRPPNDRGG